LAAVDGDARPRASRTAVLVCQGRAAAHQRIAPNRFSDPTAMTMLRDDERVPVEQVRAGTPPRGWAKRGEFEMVRASAEVIVPRTIAIDEAVRVRLTPQLVILGAGLDGRAWRMAELGGVEVFEVDHPASQQDKRERVGDLQPLARSLRYLPVDFSRDRLDAALAAAGHQQSVPTTWVWEGVVPYLGKADVTATVAILAAQSAPGSCLVVNYQTPAPSAVIGRLAVRTMSALARQPSPWRSEPRRSSWTPNAMRDLLTSHGFTADRDDDLVTLAEQLPIPVRQRRSLRNGRVAIASISAPRSTGGHGRGHRRA
jgi:methyltransferase (TIGR00027 family)